MKVAAYLDKWLEHIQSQVSPRTHERYAEITRKNIVPLLGSVILANLKPAQISEAYAKALTSGRRNGTGGLSPRTVTHMHRVLRQALGQAVRWQMLVRNPTDAAPPPKVKQRQMSVLDVDQTVALIEEARGHALFIPVLLASMLGMRHGELTALRWKAVDLDAAQLAVVASTEQTKTGCREKDTKSGRARTIALPALVVDELREHRIAQAEALLRLGMRLTNNHHVVMQADGKPVQPRSLTHAFEAFLAAKGYPRTRLHDLRHTHATHLLASGIHPKVASERLGHSKVGITLDLYSHVLPGMQQEAASKIDAAFKAARKPA